MRLVELSFDDFKNIENGVLEVEKDITCLVGINEAGKSNLLVGLEKCGNGNNVDVSDISRYSSAYLTKDLPKLKMTFVPINKEEAQELADIIGQKKIDRIIMTKVDNKYRLDYPEIILPKIPEPKEGEELAQEQDPGALRIEQIKKVLAYLPKFKYFDSTNLTEYYINETGEYPIPELMATPDDYKPVVNLLHLAGVELEELAYVADPASDVRRDTILRNGTNKINKELLNPFWPVDDIKIIITAKENKLNVRFSEVEEFLPGERSKGLRWGLAFNTYFLTPEKNGLEKTVLLIDEPGVFLHIEAQKKMIRSTFSQITSKGNQIIYSTHLPYLIDRDFPERIRILDKTKGKTSIGNKAWSTSEFGSIPEPVRTAIGLNIEDAFLFGKHNLIVEGPTDQIYLRIILNKFQPDFQKDICIVPAYGSDKMPKIASLCLLSGNESIVLTDGDVDQNILFEKYNETFSSAQVVNISSLSGEAEIVTIEDILPEDIFKQAVAATYQKIFNKRGMKLLESEIPMKTPRVVNIQNYFRQKLNASKHNFPKMDIAREFAIIAESNTGLPKQWDTAKQVVAKIKKIAK